ncbi:oxygenase MpaB family protein [Mucilaginibacter koreensis]
MSAAYPINFLRDSRSKGDSHADDFIQNIFADTLLKQKFANWLKDLNCNQQLSDLPAAYINEPLLQSALQLPDWADKKQLKAGAAFFAKHAQLIMNLLGLLSLPYCYAGADGAMVLYLSDRFRNNIGKRLADTAQFVWDVMAPGAFEPEGKGFAACLKTRLMHAAGRYYTVKSGQWDTAWGKPINQEDMAGTNLSFSLLVIRGLRKFGVVITYVEQEAYLHLWNVIGYLLGLDASLLPADGKQAYNLEEAIRQHQFRPSEQGKTLTASLIQYFSFVTPRTYFSITQLVHTMRYLLGDEIADMLALPKDTLSTLELRLLKASAFINELTAPANTTMAYQKSYQQFKQAQTI